MFIFGIIIFVILVGIAVFLIFSYENRIRQLKRDVMIANSHVSNLRSKSSKDSSSNNTRNSSNRFNSQPKIQVKFLDPSEKSGIVNENSCIYIAPLTESPTLLRTSVKMEVTIIDRAESYGLVWYYVMLPVDTNINSRGWVRKTDFTFFYSRSNNVSRS